MEVKDAPEWTPSDPRKEIVKIEQGDDIINPTTGNKAKGADSGKKKNKLKRIVVGVFMGGFGLWPMYAGPLYYILVGHMIGYKCFSELTKLERNVVQEDTQTWNKGLLGQGKLRRMQYAIYFLMLYCFLDVWLRRSLLTNSGFGPDQYPLLHDVLYNWRLPITLFLAIIILIRFTYDLREESKLYQFRIVGSTIVIAFWTA